MDDKLKPARTTGTPSEQVFEFDIPAEWPWDAALFRRFDIPAPADGLKRRGEHYAADLSKRVVAVKCWDIPDLAGK